MKKEKFVHEKPIDFGPLTEDELILRIVRNLEADLATVTERAEKAEGFARFVIASIAVTNNAGCVLTNSVGALLARAKQALESN